VSRRWTVALGAVAWAVLVAWAWSPMGRLLDHQSLAGESGWFSATVLLAGWLLMVVAMMLPSLAPLLARPGGSAVPVIAGFLGVWLLFGDALIGVDSGLHRLLDSTGTPPGALLPLALALAVAYQLSPTERRQLGSARAPIASRNAARVLPPTSASQ
jgi:predicted metal-binding membrane protein